MFTWFLRIVGAVQIILGVAYLLVPGSLLAWMGHSAAAPDLYYPLGMLAARFVAYGLGFLLVSRAPQQHVLWIGLMALIQALDAAVGIYYSAAGVVSWHLSGFPLFNAAWIGGVCAVWAWRRRGAVKAAAAFA